MDKQNTQDDLRGNSVAALTLRKDRKKKIIKAIKRKDGKDVFTPYPEVNDSNYNTNY